MAASLTTLPNAAELKARFKARCAQTGNVHQNWQIRVHRSLSWMQRCTTMSDDLTEAKFLYLWIAFNSLYARWDPQTNSPASDNAARRKFVERIINMDTAGIVSQQLHTHRGLVKKLLSNPFLSEAFWRNPDDTKAKGHATQEANYLDRSLKNKEYERLMGLVLDRLGVFRGQIVHGSSSSGSRLNRTTLAYCTKTLEHLVPALVLITIDHGANDNWPDLCYPPMP